MRCPFGCRQAHRKESSKKRVAEYYRSKDGKEKKKTLNNRRSNKTTSDKGSEDLAKEELSGQKGQVIQDEHDVVGNKATVSYIQMLISLIEGRLVNLDEVLQMLRKVVRQHSMYRQRRFIYTFTYPEQKPP